MNVLLLLHLQFSSVRPQDVTIHSVQAYQGWIVTSCAFYDEVLPLPRGLRSSRIQFLTPQLAVRRDGRIERQSVDMSTCLIDFIWPK